MGPKRAFIFHGYQGFPEEAWQPWLKAELERHGFLVALPAMPHPDNPAVNEWLQFIASLVGTPDEDTVLIAHSMGGFAVILYLETLGLAGKSVGKTVLVATGYPSGLSPQAIDERTGGDPVLRLWLARSVDARMVKRAAGRCTVILADDDPYVSLDEARTSFTRNLGATVVIEKGLGHMNEDSHISQLPSALAAALP